MGCQANSEGFIVPPDAADEILKAVARLSSGYVHAPGIQLAPHSAPARHPVSAAPLFGSKPGPGHPEALSPLGVKPGPGGASSLVGSRVMRWYKATLQASEGNIGFRTLALMRKFMEPQMSAAASPRDDPCDLAILQAGDDLMGSVDLYFTPACHPHLEVEINTLGGERCERPSSAASLVLIAGALDRKEQFF